MQPLISYATLSNLMQLPKSYATLSNLMQLLNTKKDGLPHPFYRLDASYNPMLLEMTMRCTSLVPS